MNLAQAKMYMRSAEEWMQTRSVRSRDVLTIADDTGCSPYDAEYIALAQHLDVPLVHVRPGGAACGAGSGGTSRFIQRIGGPRYASKRYTDASV